MKLDYGAYYPKVGREHGYHFLSSEGWDALKNQVEQEFRKTRPNDSWDDLVKIVEDYFAEVAKRVSNYTQKFEEDSKKKLELLKQFKV